MAVVGVQTWPGPDRALLQHENGRAGSVRLDEGSVPSSYHPLPSPKTDPPVLADACEPDAHRFPGDPVASPPDPVPCKRCGLTSHVLMDHLGHRVWNRYPAVCTACGTELAADDDRLFTHDRFVCPDCQGVAWNVYADEPTDALDRHLLVCYDSPLTAGSGDCDLVQQATPETTRRFLPAVEGSCVTDEDTAPCPACGCGQLAAVEPDDRVLDRLFQLAGFATRPTGDPVAADLFPAGTARGRLDATRLLEATE